MSGQLQVELPDETATEAWAQRLAPLVGSGGVVFLHGDLGAGKTTLTRALLRSLGVGERIKSPTYSLIESYNANGVGLHHLDLYRIADAGELEWLGLADLCVEPSLLLVEWPERGQGALPAPDLILHLAYAGAGRRLEAEATSARGQAWLAALA